MRQFDLLELVGAIAFTILLAIGVIGGMGTNFLFHFLESFKVELNPKQSCKSVEIALFIPNSMEVLGRIVDC